MPHFTMVDARADEGRKKVLKPTLAIRFARGAHIGGEGATVILVYLCDPGSEVLYDCYDAGAEMTAKLLNGGKTSRKEDWCVNVRNNNF